MPREILANGTLKPTRTEWDAINWRRSEKVVRNLRQRIYRATQGEDFKKVRSLQKLMLRSHSNTVISVRRVTQINDGKDTAGLDKLIVKTPEARGRLVNYLDKAQPWRAKPVRRVYIPKSNGKLRALGIPSILDRALQAKVKNALEPSWEARFEASSYGFRPGRSCHDAIGRIYTLATPNKNKKWILDADIKGAFDNICQGFLLKSIGKVPGRELIKQWLKAGYVEKGKFHETDRGTPQGGIISPVLLNIALHGMEEALGVKSRGKRIIVRYADDVVVFCESQQDAEIAWQILNQWLEKRGLELSAEKTQIVHITEGFNFLGFNIRHYQAPKTSRSGYKLLIKPTKESEKKLREKLKQVWMEMRGNNVKAVIKRINPIIRGWANYFRIGVAKESFHKLDRWMYEREGRYVQRSHPNKSWQWRKRKYWGKLSKRGDNWVFGDKQTGAHLLKFSWFNIERHILVKGKASPDDPRLREYFENRAKAKAKDLRSGEQKLARDQSYECRVCGESLFNGEELQPHHIEPRSRGGKDQYSNLTLVHLYCHQQIHRGKGSNLNLQELLKQGK